MNKLDFGTILEAAHAATSLDAFEQITLPLLRQHIACDQLFFVVRSGIRGPALGFDERVRQTTAGRFSHYSRELEPFRRAAASNGGVGVDREFFGSTALQRTAHYREIMRPHSGQSTLLGYLSFQGEAVGGVVFGRSTPGFLEAEQRLLREALPALSLARAAFRPLSQGRAREILPAVAERLSPRERDVLSYLILGYTNAEIALACGTSFRTVRNQLTSLFRKVGATTRAEAVSLSLRQ